VFSINFIISLRSNELINFFELSIVKHSSCTGGTQFHSGFATITGDVTLHEDFFCILHSLIERRQVKVGSGLVLNFMGMQSWRFLVEALLGAGSQ
jgi:hypothetical protein